MKRRVSASFALVRILAALLVSILTTWPCADAATTRIVEYAGAPINVHLGVGNTTEVELPEAIVDVVTALSVGEIEVDYHGSHLFLHALQPIQGELFAISDSGVSYMLVATTFEEDRDTAVRVEATGTQTRQRLLAARTLTAVNLLRAMVRKETLPGVEYAEASQQEIYHDGTLSLKLIEAYFAPRMRGYVLLAENLTGVSVPVPVQNLAIPGLLAVGADQQLLSPRPQTVEEQLAAAHQSQVYVVVK
jgi:hypothetical protein